jgi:primosomal protein N' (replication factor Y)
VERAQLLVESTSRPALQVFLSTWSSAVAELARARRVRCNLEVDPLEI